MGKKYPQHQTYAMLFVLKSFFYVGEREREREREIQRVVDCRLFPREGRFYMSVCIYAEGGLGSSSNESQNIPTHNHISVIFRVAASQLEISIFLPSKF